jgi:hypothetical protein
MDAPRSKRHRRRDQALARYVGGFADLLDCRSFMARPGRARVPVRQPYLHQLARHVGEIVEVGWLRDESARRIRGSAAAPEASTAAASGVVAHGSSLCREPCPLRRLMSCGQ